MTRSSGTVQSMTRRLFAFEVAASSDAEELAAGADIVFRKLSTQLEPLIGPAGFQVLCARALHLTKREFPILAGVKSGAVGNPGLLGLRDAVRGQEPTEAGAAIMAIVAHLLELLTNFIGEDLTMRLVSRAWPDLPSGNADSASDREMV